MLNTVIISDDPFDPTTWATHNDIPDVCAFLASHYDGFPDTARIYHMSVSQDNDVTPSDELGIERLQTLSGTFYIVNYPEGPIATIIIALVVAVAAVVLLAPDIPTVTTRNTQAESPNNALSKRQNQARINGRVPDVYGQVRSTPDLLAVPYKIYEDNIEVEYLYGCIGRGDHEIDTSEIRDDKTRVIDIVGMSTEIYAPLTSPNGTGAAGIPATTIGPAITEKIKTVSRSSSVNGQVARPSNGGEVTAGGTTNMVVDDANTISIITSDLSFSDVFEVGDVVTLVNFVWSSFTTGTVNIDLDGDYEISSVSDLTMSFNFPELVNADWLLVPAANPLGNTNNVSGNLKVEATTPIYIGPFSLDDPNTNEVVVNFVATQGLYKDNGTTQTRFDVELQVELTPVNAAGSPVGPPELFNGTVIGSAISRGTRAVTIRCLPTFTSRMTVRVTRLTDTDTDFAGTVADEIKWRDLYAMGAIVEEHFGDVTTVHARIPATDSALALKERKLNMLATRKIPLRISGTTFTSTLEPTTRIDEIIMAACLDPRIGNRNISEVDVDNIYDTVAAIETTFGTDLVVTFGYTFDSANLSFEETMSSLAGAVFCKAFRRGNVIKLTFEEETDDSVLLFNHRNKIPSGSITETRTVRFGTENNHDGVEFEYVDPTDDAIVTFSLPANLSAINPKKIESIGVRGKLHAHFHAHRINNKLAHQNTSTEFVATQEADILVVSERILVADNTRGDIQDGQILAQNGLVITLSQPVVLLDGFSYNVFVQHIDGTVESIDIVNAVDEFNVTLAMAPSLTLNVDPETYAQAGYLIVHDQEPRQQAFLLTEKEPQGNFATTIRAINYDARYYTNDTDFITGAVDAGGNAV